MKRSETAYVDATQKRRGGESLRAGALLGALVSGGRQPLPRDELVVLIEAPPASIDPRYSVGAYDFKLARLVYAPLVSVDDAALEPRLELADDVRPESSPSPSGAVRWRIHLRTARFSDGNPVTAADVVATLHELAAPGGRLHQRFVDDGLIAADAVDDRTIDVRLAHAHAPFVTDLDFGIWERTASEWPLVGAGAFVPAGATHKEWRFVRNDYYYGGRAPSARLTVRVVADDNARLLALVGGDGDLTQNTISPLLLDAVAAEPRLSVKSGRSSVFSYLGLNCEDPILRDVRVRQAIAYALDRPLIIRTKLRDRAVLASGLLPTFHWAYSADVARYDHDIARAKRLLDEAGYPDPDGDGPRPRFSLVYKTSSNKQRVALARVLVDMLQKVGIDVELRPYEFATFFADIKKGNFQLFSMQIPEIAEPDLYTDFFSSTRIPTHEQLDAGANRVRYRNPELERLLVAGRQEMDRARRQQIYAAVQQILARDLPVIPLWHEDNVAVMRRAVHGFVVLPTGQFSRLDQTSKTPN